MIRRVATWGGWVVLAWIVGAALVLSLGPGCGPIPPPVIDCRTLGCPAGSSCKMDDAVVPAVYVCVPDEPPPPPACPEDCGHGMYCPDPAAGCVPIPAPGVVCAPGETCGCYVFPPDEPAWRELTCEPRPNYDVSCVERSCVYTAVVQDPCMDGADLVVAPDQTPAQLYRNDLKAATTALGDPTGRPERETLERLAAYLRAHGLACSFAGAEAVFVRRPDRLYEEYHAVAFTDGGWTDNGYGKYVGLHYLREDGPPQLECSAPLPDRDPLRLRINAKPHNRWVDGTLLTKNTCDYCLAIGMGDPGPDGVPTRCSCPMRNECKAEGEPGPQNFKCGERADCEMYAAGDLVVWQTDPPVGEVVLNDGNPWQATCTACARLRVCTADLAVCSAWVDKP